MKFWSRNTLWKVFVFALLLINPGGLAAHEPAAAQPISEAPAPPPAVPHLANLIPRVTALAGRLAELEMTLKSESDPSDLKNSLVEIDSHLKNYAAQWHKLKTASIAGGGQDMNLQSEITSEGEVLAGVSQSVTEQVRKLVDVRHEWVAEQEQWKTWRAALLADEPLAEIKATFDKADQTIDTALSLIIQQLQPLLALQGWFLLLQGMLALALVLAFFRYRQRLAGSERWQFVAHRPIAAGLFASLQVGFRSIPSRPSRLCLPLRFWGGSPWPACLATCWTRAGASSWFMG